MPEDAPYDPYIPSGQAAPQQQGGSGGNARTQALQALRCFCRREDAFLFPLLDGLCSGSPDAW
ncbi:LOW QUALITY PROTEIN: synaptobrevin [Colletotrichum tofieldiae]|nr:LOW QUALITY PROTEIN: synaptobrevin [Colletotrichum tofieldiae]GKT69283.1 LOW QUALITY PROTEIN: synaptobrevin [Colletotrichum tofieldiae]